MLRRSDDDEERAQWSIGLWITLKEKSCRRRHISSSVLVNAFQLLEREKSFWYHIQPYRPTATPTPVMHPSSTLLLPPLHTWLHPVRPILTLVPPLPPSYLINIPPADEPALIPLKLPLGLLVMAQPRRPPHAALPAVPRPLQALIVLLTRLLTPLQVRMRPRALGRRIRVHALCRVPVFPRPYPAQICNLDQVGVEEWSF
jgi:hypothetical protein